jgi:hypothetical protein
MLDNLWVTVKNYIDLYLMMNLNIEILVSFMLDNKYILLFLLMIYIGILLDNTFKWRNKLLILIALILFVLFTLIFRGNILFNEIFWYTLILNGSFIFHVCICDWLYRLFRYYRKDYICWIVTRISFIFSMSFIVYLINNFYLYLYHFYDEKCYKNKWFILLIFNLQIIVYFMLLISIFFIIIFANYSMLLKGIINNNMSIKNIIYIIIYIIITLIISIYFLGIPRLYFIWFILLVNYIYNKLIMYKIKFIYWNWISVFENDFLKNLEILGIIYDEPYTQGFNYGFLEFINYIRIILLKDYYEFHLKSPFIYYRRDLLILTYFRSHFKKIISINNNILKNYYDRRFELALYHLNLKDDEKEKLDEKLKKIYKKTLKI